MLAVANCRCDWVANQKPYLIANVIRSYMESRDYGGSHGECSNWSSDLRQNVEEGQISLARKTMNYSARR